MMGYYGNMYGWGMAGVIGGVLMIVFWVILIFVIVWMSRELSRRNHNDRYHNHNGGSALEILKRRYAKGDITREEYEAKRKDILG